MSENNDLIHTKILKFIDKYTKMKIGRISVHCPYWMNKIKNGKVVLRGFLNGKGDADEIRQELIKRLKIKHEKINELTSQELLKFAKRKRIGIDCSGFAYRLLNEIVHFGYKSTIVSDLSEIFKDGINKTNAKTLTSQIYTRKVNRASQIQLGDLIRMMNGRHVAVILWRENSQLTYVHSSKTTRTQGVHLGFIKIIDKNNSIGKQTWLEKTRRGDNFGLKYLHEDNRDGVYRLKILN